MCDTQSKFLLHFLFRHFIYLAELTITKVVMKFVTSDTLHFRYDAVKGSKSVKEWRDEDVSVSSRSRFDGSNLVISHVVADDAGTYR